MSPTTERMTVSDWDAELGRRRTPRAAGSEQAGLDELRQRFRDISARTRDQHQSAWIGRPAYLPLRKLSDQALELTRLAHQELSRYDAADVEVAPLGLLDLL